MNKNIAAAAEEIKAILKKHDCAGVVLLSHQQDTEWFYDVNKSWSCCQIGDGKMSFDIKGLSSAETKAKVEATIAMLVGLHTATEKATDDMTLALGMFGDHFDIKTTTRAKS